MVSYILRRLAYMVILLVALSVVVFIVIQLPPGDMMTVMLARMEAGGADASLGGEEITAMQKQYGLHLPAYLQYLRWAGNLLRGNLGPSFVYGRPVTVLLLERLPLTMLLSGITLLFAYVVAIPIGIYSATHQYSLGDYGFTVVGFVGLATPNFLLALILMYLLLTLFGVSPGGLFSGEFEHAPWSFAKFLNGLGHLPLPIIVIGMAGTAAIIRVMRGTLLADQEAPEVVDRPLYRQLAAAQPRLAVAVGTVVALDLEHEQIAPPGPHREALDRGDFHGGASLAQERASYPSSMPNISSRMCARWACSTRYE